MATANYNTFLENQTYNPAQAATPATGLINTPATASTAAPATTYTGAMATAAPVTVDPTKTVQSQVKAIIDDNSPLMQQAATRANQAANSRGLLNSSIAVGAGQSAVLDAATPIANADANIYANANLADASNKQQMNLANQNSSNTSNQFNSAAANTVKAQNSQLETNVNLSNATEANRMAQFKENLQADTARFNASESNTLIKLGMDAQTRTGLANIEASYKTLLQSQASAGELYKQMVLNSSNIMQNKDMDAATKQTALNNQIALLNSGLGVIGKIANIDMGDLLQFSGPAASEPAPGTALAPVAPPPPPAAAPASPWDNNNDYASSYGYL